MLTPEAIGIIGGIVIQSLIENSLTASSSQGQAVFSMFASGSCIISLYGLFFLILFCLTKQNSGVRGILGFAVGFFVPALIWAVHL